MLSEIAVMAIGWLLLISGATYLIALFRVVSLLKNNYPDYWGRIGSPNLFDVNSVATIFPKIIVGLDIPDDANAEYRPLLWTLRISLLVSTGIFFFMMAVIALGMAPK